MSRVCLLATGRGEVRHRRDIAEALAVKHDRADTENMREAFIKIQEAIEAIERAVWHERYVANSTSEPFSPFRVRKLIGRAAGNSQRYAAQFSAKPAHVFGSEKTGVHRAIVMVAWSRWLPARSDISATAPRDEAPSGSQRIVVMAAGLHGCRTASREDQAMNRWQELVDNLLTDLARETPGAHDLRMHIDYKIWRAEQTVSYAVPTTPYESTVRRLHGFQRELIERLSKRLKNDPANESLLEARSLLENPWLRVPEHQRPDLR